MNFILKPAVLVLLAAIFIPLAGVIAWGWDALVLLVLYWLETAVIAFWTVLHIAAVRGDSLGDLKFGDKCAVSPLGMGAFVTLHAGLSFKNGASQPSVRVQARC